MCNSGMKGTSPNPPFGSSLGPQSIFNSSSFILYSVADGEAVIFDCAQKCLPIITCFPLGKHEIDVGERKNVKVRSG